MQLHFDSDIPYIWTALFHWLGYMLFLTLLPKRWRELPTILISLLFLPVQMALYSVIGPLRGMAFNLGMLLFAVWTLFPFIVLCEIPLLNRLYYCARSFIISGFTVSLAWQIYHHYALRVRALSSFWWEVGLMLAIGGIVLVGFWLIERLHKSEMREMTLSVLQVMETVVIAFAVYILSSLSYTALDTPFSAEGEAQVFMTRTMVYFGGAAVLYALHLRLCESYALKERDALQRILDQQYESYRVRQESIQLVNQKYHDLKHQIAVLRTEVGAGRAELLDRLESEIRTYEAQNKTGNDVLDTILSGKSLYCQEHGITLTVVADGHALGFMNVMDLSALFGNALDNAIEAAEKVEPPEERLIMLSVSRQKGFLRMQVKNRYNAAPITAGALPASTKADKRFHGYGLKSIRSTVEKYGGSVAVHGENGWFELGVLIPLNEAV